MTLNPNDPMPTYEPVRILELELSKPIPDLDPVVPNKDIRYRHAQALIRLHGQPLDVIKFDLGDNGLKAEQVANIVWKQSAALINAHLAQDNLPQLEALPVAGIRSADPNALPCFELARNVLKNPPFVSIILCTRDRPQLCKRIIQSLLELNYPKYEIVVVDNAPATDATAKVVKQDFAHVSNLRYVREDRPGLSWARNAGAWAALGEIVAYIDDDLIIDRDWLIHLVAGFQVGENVGCVSGLIYPLELDTLPQEWFEQYGGFARGFSQKLYDNGPNRRKSWAYPYSTGHLGTGASMALKASVLKKIGYFDPALGTGTVAKGGEDLAIFFEVIIRGFQVVYEPRSVGYHQHRTDYEGLRKQVYGYGVGLSAYLMKVLLDKPWRVLAISWRIPGGLFIIFSKHSPKEQLKQANYPAELTRLERRGMLDGPWAFIRSRWHTRNLLRQERAAAVTPLPASAK